MKGRRWVGSVGDAGVQRERDGHDTGRRLVADLVRVLDAVDEQAAARRRQGREALPVAEALVVGVVAVVAPRAHAEDDARRPHRRVGQAEGQRGRRAAGGERHREHRDAGRGDRHVRRGADPGPVGGRPPPEDGAREHRRRGAALDRHDGGQPVGDGPRTHPLGADEGPRGGPVGHGDVRAAVGGDIRARVHPGVDPRVGRGGRGAQPHHAGLAGDAGAPAHAAVRVARHDVDLAAVDDVHVAVREARVAGHDVARAGGAHRAERVRAQRADVAAQPAVVDVARRVAADAAARGLARGARRRGADARRAGLARGAASPAGAAVGRVDPRVDLAAVHVESVAVDEARVARADVADAARADARGVRDDRAGDAAAAAVEDLARPVGAEAEALDLPGRAECTGAHAVDAGLGRRAAVAAAAAVVPVRVQIGLAAVEPVPVAIAVAVPAGVVAVPPVAARVAVGARRAADPAAAAVRDVRRELDLAGVDLQAVAVAAAVVAGVHAPPGHAGRVGARDGRAHVAARAAVADVGLRVRAGRPAGGEAEAAVARVAGERAGAVGADGPRGARPAAGAAARVVAHDVGLAAVRHRAVAVRVARVAGVAAGAHRAGGAGVRAVGADVAAGAAVGEGGVDVGLAAVRQVVVAVRVAARAGDVAPAVDAGRGRVRARRAGDLAVAAVHRVGDRVDLAAAAVAAVAVGAAGRADERDVGRAGIDHRRDVGHARVGRGRGEAEPAVEGGRATLLPAGAGRVALADAGERREVAGEALAAVGHAGARRGVGRHLHVGHHARVDRHRLAAAGVGVADGGGPAAGRIARRDAAAADAHEAGAALGGADLLARVHRRGDDVHGRRVVDRLHDVGVAVAGVGPEGHDVGGAAGRAERAGERQAHE